MKISKLFHWLYASLMFLPLLVAPIFAIYSHRHTIDTYEVVTGGYEVQDLYETNVPLTQEGDIYLTDGFIYKLDIDLYGQEFAIVLSYGDLYIDYISYIDSDYGSFLEFYNDSGILYLSFYNGLFYVSNDGDSPNIVIVTDSIYVASSNWTDFNSYFDQEGVQFQISDFIPKRVIYNDGLIYNDTDIGSQFIYCLYNTTEKYLNFDSVFNLYQVNNWINLNVFNGNAPIVWTIIWHYLDYWLLLSIFWLCFDVLIYVPQLAHRWLDKASLE